MGIISRFKDIMAANINALLDKAEDPEKMIDQYLRNLESDLAKVKQETASVMAEETKTKRQLDECTEEIAKMQAYAEKAVLAGNDEDAKKFLMKKKDLVVKQASLQETYKLAADNAAKMRQMHDKLVSDISQLDARRDALKAKIAVAKTQETINKIGSSVNGAADSLSAFDKLEAKVNRKLDEANAMAELNNSGVNEVNDLERKYGAYTTSEVDDELAALKAKVGQN
ncbi:phage shock protein A-like protein [Firmicutes bacterium CAG:882]|jgi:phage shock protein A|nr:phage shock protein A-like protein [Firmicutes bacterium CAG:882]